MTKRRLILIAVVLLSIVSAVSAVARVTDAYSMNLGIAAMRITAAVSTAMDMMAALFCDQP